MLNTANEYYECPICGWVISFQYNINIGVYKSKCPFCGNLLEVEREEFENDMEVYFEAE